MGEAKRPHIILRFDRAIDKALLTNSPSRVIKEAEQWLRAIHDWLIFTDKDMKLPNGVLDTDPLDIAERLSALPTKDD